VKLKVDFWDVGQGDCSVVHLPDGNLFVIDVGPPNSPLLRWIESHPRLPIHSIVLTHNDADHAGCAFDILNRFKQRISYFVFVDDRAYGTTEATDQLLTFAAGLHKRGEIQMVRLEVLADPLPLWGFDGGTNFQVIIYALYPNIGASIHGLHGRSSSQPNEVSGILCLDVNGKTEVIWTGDASMQTVSQVCRSLKPSVIVGPHHGGPIKRNQASFVPSFNDPQPDNVFVSVGSTNGNSHPVKKFVGLHCAHGRRVCCSQLVHCDRERFLKQEHVLNSHLQLGILPPKESTAVTCRGPMQISWNFKTHTFRFDRFHQRHKGLLSDVARPYCQ